jgi:hypothetical protein
MTAVVRIMKKVFAVARLYERKTTLSRCEVNNSCEFVLPVASISPQGLVPESKIKMKLEPGSPVEWSVRW